MKFCQEANPDWTVEAAVWCDDKFEFNIEDPQYLKVSKKNKATGKKAKKGALHTENSEGSQINSLADIVPPGQTLVVKVSDQGQITSSEVTVETTAVGSQGIAVDGEEAKMDQSLSSISARTVGTLTYATPGSKHDSDEMASDPNAIDSEYLGSQLLCGTCKMQFDSVSSLREHLSNIHNTTLAESDVSYVFEDGTNTEQNGTILGPVNVSNEIKDQVMSENQSGITLQDLKPVVVSIDALSQKKGRDGAVEDDDVECLNVCRMCSQGFYYRDDLDQHMKSHTDEEVESVGMHRCDTCSLVLKNTQEVAKHIQRCHGVSKIFSCSICDKEFFQESSVYRHMKFFHKWEIKIRGEINIPVIVKPAPKNLHSPAASSSGYTMPKTRTDRRKMGRYGKISAQGTVGAKVDKIIQEVVGPKVEVSDPATDTSLVKIELTDQEANLSDKSIVDSLKGSIAGKESQSPSFIIVRDVGLTEEGDTQKIVEKLMTLFRSKAADGDGESNKIPKIVKVTTVGFSQDEMNTITETDLTEALSQIDEKYEASSSKSHTNTLSSLEIVSQSPGRKDENYSGKGYISTLQGKKRVVALGPANENARTVGEEIKSEITSASSEINVDSIIQKGTSGIANFPADSSLFKLLQNDSHSHLLTKVCSADGSSVAQKDQMHMSVKAINNISVSESEEFVQTSCGNQKISDKSRTVDIHQNVSQQNVLLEGFKKLDSLKNDLENEKREKSISKTGEGTVKVQGSVSKKSTISTLAAPAQDQGLSLKSLKTSKNTSNSTIDRQNALVESRTVNVSSTASEKISEGKVAKTETEKTNSSDQESNVPDVKIPKSTLKKAPRGKTTSEKSAERTEPSEPQPERRSSSGRLIKRKTFGDEIEDMSPLRKRYK